MLDDQTQHEALICCLHRTPAGCTTAAWSSSSLFQFLRGQSVRVPFCCSLR
jgi:hypothetical protein